jgi:ATP-dependent DNA helicase DinG
VASTSQAVPRTDSPAPDSSAADSAGAESPLQALLATAVSAIGGTERSGQTVMAQAVWDAVTNRTHLAVQAGTGTGKSLAYLVPAMQLAADKRGPVVVSTATIALQRQLVDRDLPRLADALRSLFRHR